jgi:hypothetical protein
MPGSNAGQKKAPIWTRTCAAQTMATRCTGEILDTEAGSVILAVSVLPQLSIAPR